MSREKDSHAKQAGYKYSGWVNRNMYRDNDFRECPKQNSVRSS